MQHYFLCLVPDAVHLHHNTWHKDATASFLDFSILSLISRLAFPQIVIRKGIALSKVPICPFGESD